MKHENARPRSRDESGHDSQRLPPLALRAPMRHGCHYLDLTAAIASYDDGADFARFREDETSGDDMPAW